MITLLLIALLVVIVGIITLISMGVFALSFWWVFLIAADVALAIFIITCICKLFRRKKKK